MKLKINESLNEATDNQYLYCQASIEDDVRDYLTDDELSEISSYIGSDGTIINCEFGRCDIQFSDEFIAHQIPVEYLNIEMDGSLNEDALDDHGVSRANVNLLAKRVPNGRFYFNRNRYVLGKELPDYFDDNEVILYSDYQDSDDIRIPNAYKILKRFTEELKESTNSLDDYKVYKILINALVPNSVNLARHLSPNGECYNEIVDVLRKNGLNLADAIIDYKENPELTKRLHDMGIVHGNSTIEELTDKVLKKLDDNGYDTSDRDVRNYAEAAAELIINDVNQDIDDWYSETLINYPEDLEELPKK